MFSSDSAALTDFERAERGFQAALACLACNQFLRDQFLLAEDSCGCNVLTTGVTDTFSEFDGHRVVHWYSSNCDLLSNPMFNTKLQIAERTLGVHVIFLSYREIQRQSHPKHYLKPTNFCRPQIFAEGTFRTQTWMRPPGDSDRCSLVERKWRAAAADCCLIGMSLWLKNGTMTSNFGGQIVKHREALTFLFGSDLLPQSGIPHRTTTCISMLER